MSFLSSTAAHYNMAIGLKNAGSIAANVTCMVEFAIVESCKHPNPCLVAHTDYYYQASLRVNVPSIKTSSQPENQSFRLNILWVLLVLSASKRCRKAVRSMAILDFLKSSKVKSWVVGSSIVMVPCSIPRHIHRVESLLKTDKDLEDDM